MHLMVLAVLHRGCCGHDVGVYQRTVATFPDLKELYGNVKDFNVGAADVFVTQAVLNIIYARLREVMYTGM